MNTNYIIRRIKWMNDANEELKGIFEKTKIRELEGIYWDFKEYLLEILKQIELNKSDLSKKSKEITCTYCGYKWNTRSKNDLVSCVKCGNKTRIKKRELIKKDGLLYVKGHTPEDMLKEDEENEIVTCFKCDKKLKKSDSEFGYNSYFHKKCYKKFRKDALEEVNKGLKKII